MHRSALMLCYLLRPVGLIFAVLLALGSVPECRAQSAPTAADSIAAQRAEDEHLARRGFYRRRATGVGWFATRSDPVMARSLRLSDVLRIVPGINVIEQGAGALVVSGRSPGHCPLAVFVDGTYTTIRNVDELSVEDTAAVEVYRGPTDIPAGFHAPGYDRTCGALLVWSRMQVD
ncbi:MAG: TonB-dependent receptor plug domain-containing protein [Rhodothermales bacterium]